MLLTHRLVRLIETHSEQLASGLLKKLQTCDRCEDFDRVPPEEFKQRVTEVYHYLGEWLLSKTEADVARHYKEIARRRAQQKVPLSQVIWAIALTKENLVEFLQRETAETQVAEVFGELELIQLLEQFYDRAMFYAALGYEEARSTRATAAGT